MLSTQMRSRSNGAAARGSKKSLSLTHSLSLLLDRRLPTEESLFGPLAIFG